MSRGIAAVIVLLFFTLACAFNAEEPPADPTAKPAPTTDLRTITAGVVATVEAQNSIPTPTVHPQIVAYQARLEEAGISPTQRQTDEACRWLLAVDQKQHTLNSYYRRQLEVALEQPWTPNVVVSGRDGRAAFEQWNNAMNTESAERNLIRKRMYAIYLVAQAMEGMEVICRDA